jgi:hypothetical protein
MSEVGGGTLAKLGERFMEGVPGFALVAIVVASLMPFMLPTGPESPSEPRAQWIFRQALPVIAFVLAWVGYFLGHYLDDLLFDPIWGVPDTRGPKESFRRRPFFDRLNNSRTELADHWERPVTGIFVKAQELMGKTELWEKKIKWPLEWSKAFRSFVVLCVVGLILGCAWWWIASTCFVSFVSLFVQTKKFWTACKILIFETTLVCLLATSLLNSIGKPVQMRWSVATALIAAILLCAACYVLLRIRHMTTLYALACTLHLDNRDGMFCAGQKVVPLRNVLICGDTSIRLEDFEKADYFVQSIALMHVTLRTFYGSFSDPPDVKVMELNMGLLKEQEEEVHLGNRPLRSPQHDPRAPNPILLIKVVDLGSTFRGYDLDKLKKDLNGVI